MAIGVFPPLRSVVMRPTRHLRWRSLPKEPDRFQRSVLEVLWVDDCRSIGEWRLVPRVDEDAAYLITGVDLPDLL